MSDHQIEEHAADVRRARSFLNGSGGVELVETGETSAWRMPQNLARCRWLAYWTPSLARVVTKGPTIGVPLPIPSNSDCSFSLLNTVGARVKSQLFPSRINRFPGDSVFEVFG